jgi:hypothetical protein
MEILEENLTHWNGQGVSEQDHKCIGNKSKNGKMELNSFCTAKIKSNETIYRKEKNICKLYI